MENAGRVAKKSELLDAIWTDTYIEETTLARNVSWLRQKLGEYSNGESLIETVPKVGYRFTAEVTRFAQNKTAFIIEEQTVQYIRGEETVKFDEDELEIKREKRNPTNFPSQYSTMRQYILSPFIIISAMGISILAILGFVNFNKNSESAAKNNDLHLKSKNTINNIVEYDKSTLKIGSVVHLKNQSSDDAGYLDAWGEVKSKPEFWIVPTELKFVSTHPNPNRENGSGSWKIVSANGKKDGETLVYGDKIHLQNMYSDAGFLDNCGWLKDMPVFRNFVEDQKFAVFTTWSKDRDNGTGTWVIGSNTEFDGSLVLEGASISLENGFPDGGYLDSYGRVEEIPAYSNYDGSRLVFIHASTPNRRPNSGSWIITASNATLK